MERVREVRLGPLEVAVQRRPDGSVLIDNTTPLDAYPVNITERLEYWAGRAPDRTFLAERPRGGGPWRRLSYGDAFALAPVLGAALLERGLSAERPLAILSGNDTEHALLALAALYVGVPYVPISPAYSLLSQDFSKLRHIVRLTTPGLVFASDGEAFGRALATFAPDAVARRSRRVGGGPE